MQDMTEARESIFAVEPSPIPMIPQEPEVSPSPAVDSLSATPFSWNTILDGAWKFAEEPLSPSSPAALSTPDAMLRDTKAVEAVRPEPVIDPILSAPSSTSTPGPPVSSNDPDPLPDTHPSILSDVSGSIADTTAAIRDSDVASPTGTFLSDAPLQLEEPPTLSSDATSSLKMDAPVPPLSEVVEPVREPGTSFVLVFYGAAICGVISRCLHSSAVTFSGDSRSGTCICTGFHRALRNARPTVQDRLDSTALRDTKRCAIEIQCRVGVLAKSKFSLIVHLKRNETGIKRRGMLHSFLWFHYQWLRQRLQSAAELSRSGGWESVRF